MIKLGKGGVDDAEDAEVILHEYGHAIQDSQQVPFGYGVLVRGRRDRRGLRGLLGRDGQQRDLADARRAVRRRLGLGLVHVDDPALPAPDRPQPALPGEHQSEQRPRDGRIWSRALWDIRDALGHVKADTIILEGHFGQRDPTMPQLAREHRRRCAAALSRRRRGERRSRRPSRPAGSSRRAHAGGGACGRLLPTSRGSRAAARARSSRRRCRPSPRRAPRRRGRAPRRRCSAWSPRRSPSPAWRDRRT